MAKRTNRVAWGRVSAEVWCMAVALAAVVWVVVALARNEVAQWEMSVCSEKLQNASSLFTDFRKQHAGQFPRSLQQLDLTKVGSDALRCPAAPQLGRQAYLYQPPRKDAPGETPVLICPHHPILQVLEKSGRVTVATRWPSDFDPQRHGAVRE
jgi:hypothetical protein